MVLVTVPGLVDFVLNRTVNVYWYIIFFIVDKLYTTCHFLFHGHAKKNQK